VKRNVATVWLGLALLLAGLALDLSTVRPALAQHDKAQAQESSPAVTDSLGLLEREVARDSTQFDNLFRLGVMYMDRDRLIPAIQVFQKATQLDPNHTKAWVNLGAAYDASNAPEKAQAYYQKALSISPGDPVALCRMASSVYAQGRQGEAMDMLREAIETDPSSYCAYFTLGVAFADAGIYREAIRMWRKVVQYGSGTPEAASAMESIDVLERFLGQ